MPLMSYHYAWLSVHRNRTEGWLKERLADGFDIHHLDGNHANDDPGNLCLIECDDHMRLHGLSISRLLSEGRVVRSLELQEARKAREELSARCYEMKDDSVSWANIGRALKPDSAQPAAWARSTAQLYAEREGLPFPKPNSNRPANHRSKLLYPAPAHQTP